MKDFLNTELRPGNYTNKTGLLTFPANKPVETVFEKLQPNTQYFYRLQFRKPGETNFTARPECRFHTQRAAGSTFTFAIQGDSHPERPQMSEPNLYARTLLNAAADKPDFYICMGDDFSVAPVREVNFDSVAARYTLQRPFLGLVAQSAPVFLLNGNHEQASLFNFNQTDERHAVAVHAQNARNQFYPTPAPDGFYSGDTETLPTIGLRKDYCAWTWGDALFVILDNYWHSPAQVDSGFHEEEAAAATAAAAKTATGGRSRSATRSINGSSARSEQSKAKYKFVFAHHVMGSGRGGVDECDLYEWGGQQQTRRLGIRRAAARLGIARASTHGQARRHDFFPGPRPSFLPAGARRHHLSGSADARRSRLHRLTTTTAIESGVKLPNSGHLRVTVSPENVKVEYVRSFLPKDETAQNKTGDIAHSYTVKAKALHA